MGYLEFSKEEVINLSKSLKREYIRTNRAGSYASSTIINCNTRRYHGLLVCPIKELGDSNFVLLSSLDETVIQHGAEFNLAIHRFPNEFSPTGHKYIRSYSNDPTPCMTFRVGGVILKKEMVLVQEEERILIKYTLLEANSPTTIRLKPFLAFRSFHELTKSNLQANRKYEVVENGTKSRMYDTFPFLYMQLSKKNDFVSVPDWYMNFEYEKDKEKGEAYHEDLFTPGYFEFKIKKGEEIVFSAGLSEIDTSKLQKVFTSEIAKRTPRDNFENCLINAAQQFISRQGNKTRIIASFPGFGNWGRDCLIALPGLTLSLDDPKTCKSVLDTMTDEISGYVFRNEGNIDCANVESIDTPLWYIRAVQSYTNYTKSYDVIKKSYLKKIIEILTVYKSGENHDVVMHDNGLLFLSNEHKALTWMDAKIDGYPIVKRWGYVIEINALWYNSIKFLIEFSKKTDIKVDISEWEIIASNIENSFEDIFWDEKNRYLADFNTGRYKDLTVRPNQLFVASLPFSPISETKRNDVLSIIQTELLTPKGIRSLSPKSPNYQGECSGNKIERAIAFHQGSVWPWLLAPFAEAYIGLHGQSAYSMIKRLYTGMEEEMYNHGLGSISEIFDGNPPHQARGGISQAWSVAAMLRIRKLLSNFESK